jgi:hypothetical protein
VYIFWGKKKFLRDKNDTISEAKWAFKEETALLRSYSYLSA